MLWRSASAAAVRRTVQNRASIVNHHSAGAFETAPHRAACPRVDANPLGTRMCDTARPRCLQCLPEPLHEGLSSAPSPLLPDAQQDEAPRAIPHSHSDIYRTTRGALQVQLDTRSVRRFWSAFPLHPAQLFRWHSMPYLRGLLTLPGRVAMCPENHSGARQP